MRKHFLAMALLSALAALAVLVAIYVILKLWSPHPITVQQANPAAGINAGFNAPVNEPLSEGPGYRTYDVGEKSKFIRIDLPLPADVIASPLEIFGAARTWYFEGSFPVELRDANGKVLASAPAQAKGDWMTDDFVPFELTLSFEQPTTNTGTLVFKKDNPSGLPEHDDSVTVPVHLMLGVCRPTGCSGQICSDQAVITTCEYTDAYGCYKTAYCGRQADGQCGWAQTEELKTCLDKARQ